MKLIESLGLINGAMSEQYQIGTCEHCGKPLYAINVNGFEIKISCECVLRKEQDDEQRIKAAKRQSRIERYKKECGLSPAHKSCTFENFEKRAGTDKAFKMSKRFISKFKTLGKGLIYTGSTGAGKTHLACAIANELLDRCVNVKFVRAVDLPRMIQSTYSDYTVSQDDVIRPYEKCDLLIIDDLGSDKSTEAKNAIWQSLIDYRINYGKLTIITTNLTESELNNTLDVRTMDRLIGNYYFVPIKAESYRKEHK